MTAHTRIVPRNWHDEATLSTEVPAATGFPISNTQARPRSRVWRSADTTEQFVAGSFADGIPRRGTFLGIFRHRLHGGTVSVEYFANDDFTSSVLAVGPIECTLGTDYLSPATDGFDWGIDEFSSAMGYPADTFKRDPFILESPFWIWHEEAEYLSYKITFGTGAHTPFYPYWQVSRIFLGKYVELGFGTPQGPPAFGFQLGMADLTNRNRSRGGSLRSNTGPTWRTSAFDLSAIRENERAGWLDVMRNNGTGKDFVISIFPEHVSTSTRLERDHIINAQFVALDALGRQAKVLTKRVQIEEVS